ncbi:receptor-interacting serine/threonine-protein kinase 3-like isoform X2 [Acanthopagrus latus]|uniref:receptor-interacting serine/threonine-protein kinase 3-like isoform X2 n=1 Tax=Acanthopagrus latus TaxID=8177 RepID=UPI00187BD929|nr:receptor-interacting serine/threonine-protein kinase 3-like isoform X2 [Acanthopagrus latus]
MEMALPSRKTRLVSDESLEDWEHVGSGGFGDVYRVRHKDWGEDVAIKIPRTGVCTPLPLSSYKEAMLMDTVSFKFVLRVYGIYQGCPPGSRPGENQCGIVMEYMRWGSVESLQEVLSGPPPWPLAFRLAHQVAAGMNFLHAEKLVHQDLKPSNVLLSESLDARLADFGLSRVSTSAVASSREKTGEAGGTYKYMPPEAFNASYQPVRAFDIYSYGILLWSIVTGKEPYPAATNCLVELKIPLGDRPPSEDLEKMEVEGLKELVDLMKRCWDANPDKRPPFNKCLKETEQVFSKHKRAIHVAVDQVLERLDSPNGNHHSETSISNPRPPPQAPERSMPIDEVDMPSPVTRHPPTQDVFRSSAKHMTDEEKEKFVDDNMATLIQKIKLVMKIAEELGNMVNPETYDNIATKETKQDQMRLLYRSVLHSGGKKVKAAFYDALKRNYQPLVEDLGGF